MPQILLKLLELCQSDETGMGELARLIGNDVSMSAKLLTVANSAAYYRGQPTVDLMQALSTLGANTIKTLVISESVFQTFNAFPHCGATDLRHFWHHALKTAVVARSIAARTNHPALEEAYLAGLLHDVGRLALLSAAPNEYSFNFRARDDKTLCEVEQQTLQISHTEAGAWLAARWKFTPALADSILYHHEAPDRVTQAAPLTRIVHLANWLCNFDEAQPLPDDAGELCGLSAQHLTDVRQDAEAQVAIAAEHLGIELPAPDTSPQPQARSNAEPVSDDGKQRLAHGVRDHALLSEFSLSLERARNRADLLEVVRTSARLLLGFDDAAVMLVGNEHASLAAALTPAQQHRLAGQSLLPPRGSRLANAAQAQEVVVLDKSQGQTQLSADELQLFRATGGEVLVLIPITASQQSHGLIVGSMTRARLPEIKDRHAFFLRFGAHTGQALAQASRQQGALDQRVALAQQAYRDQSRHVAHEVNNPLAIIKNYLGVVDDKLARQENVARELDLLNQEIDRVGHIVNEFAGSTPTASMQATDLTSILNDLASLFRDSKFLPRHLDIITRGPANPTPVTAPANTVRQILINLIKNAIEALPHGGRIELISQGPIHLDGRLFMQVSVKDNGPGLTPEVMQHLFSPLVSVKPGPHRGIGLTIVHSMMEKLNGSITCHNSSSGATFVTLFPCANAQGDAISL